MLTEAEAKSKWCPLVRVQNFEPDPAQNPAINRPTGDMQCIGSACMAWRKDRTSDFNQQGDFTRGYCGAFGTPE